MVLYLKEIRGVVMSSRLDRSYLENTDKEPLSTPTRSSRNSRLYKEVYGKYGDLDNLPLEDNTDEIDMERLREIISNTGHNDKEEKVTYQSLNVLEERKRKIDEQKVYDINKILEKAKYENNKLKEPVKNGNTLTITRDLLSTLSDCRDLNFKDLHEKQVSAESEPKMIKEELVEAVVAEGIEAVSEVNTTNEDNLSMTRELKFKNLEKEVNEEIASSTTDLSLDLFDDLKPTGNTIVTKPIKEDEVSIVSIKSDMHSGDTSDIDIIKSTVTSTKDSLDSDFFTSSYAFSKSDFNSDDDDFFEEKKGTGIFKIILLFLAIFIFAGVIVYFIGTYGMGM